MKALKNFIIKYREILSYLLFGAVTTVVNWAVYAVAVRLLSVDLSSLPEGENVLRLMLRGESGKNLTLLFVANLIAWLASVIVAFVTNKLWVFHSRSKQMKTVLREFWEFTAARIATGCLEWFGIPALVMAGMRQSLFGIEGFWAKAVVSVAVVVVNYVFSKFIVFRKKKMQK